MLWFAAFVISALTTNDDISETWNDTSWLFKIMPFLILIGVYYVSKWEKLCDNRQRLTELLELMAWGLVYWTVYVVVTLLLKDLKVLSQFHYPALFIAIFLIGLSLLIKLVVNYLFFTLLSSGPIRLDYSGHRYFSVQYGDLLAIGIFCTLVGLVPLAYYYLFDQDLLKQWANALLPGLSVGSVVSFAAGWYKRNKSNEQQGLVAFLLHFGLALLIVAAVLAAYGWAIDVHTDTSCFKTMAMVGWGLVFVVFLLVSDINYVSMHRYYRNRLLEAFLKEKEYEPQQQGPPSSSDNLEFRKINVSTAGGPFHLINTNLITVGSSDNKLRLRGGDNFVFSPGYIGSEHTGWRAASDPLFHKMNLATAMAISGAAVDPNTGVSRSWPLCLIMTWLNVRLGYWCPNPNPNHFKAKGLIKFVHSSWLWLIVKEMFGTPQEKWSYVRLSDGGHFENLGLYELLRRKCTQIIVSDAGADPHFTFSDLALAIERARVDFGVKIEGLNTTDIQPALFTECKEGKSHVDCLKLRLSKSPYTVGGISYDDGTKGTLIYIKTTLFEELGEDVLGYARQNPAFPDESTANQFFTEEQFEAYRELGYHAMTFAIGNLLNGTQGHPVTPHGL
jgi:hypothetical protein